MVKYLILAVVIGAVAIYYIDDYTNGCKYETDIHIDGKVVIITGGNTGIGKETMKDFVKRGAKVYIGCRSLERGQSAIDEVQAETGLSNDNMILLHLDLSSLASVRQFVEEFKNREDRLDILLNSAGVMFHPYNLTIDGYETTFATNHLGHFLLTHLLTDLLVSSAPSRVITVSSYGHYFGSMHLDNLDGESGGLFPFYHTAMAYTRSKLANVLFAKELARRLEGTGVSSFSLHPGSIKTELARHSVVSQVVMFLLNPFLKDPYHGARTSVFCALEPGLHTQSGNYFSECGVSVSSAESQDKEIAKELWEISVDLAKLQQHEIHQKLSNYIDI